jgi:Domain of unknown function (DUF1871)
MRTREDYDRAVSIVRTVIAAWDPYALIGGGAPEDEFDREVAIVVTQIPRIASGRDAAMAVSRVFSGSLGEMFTPEDCEEVGRRLFAALSSQGLVCEAA